MKTKIKWQDKTKNISNHNIYKQVNFAFKRNETHRSLYLNIISHSKNPRVFEQRSNYSSGEWKVFWALFLYQKVLLDPFPSGHWV